MESDKKLKKTKAIIALLFSINILTLGYLFWINHHEPTRKPAPELVREYIETELQFNTEQKTAFEKERERHFAFRKKTKEEIIKVRQDLFKQLKHDTPDSFLINSLIDSISLINKQLERDIYQHFEVIRNLCNPDQKKRFDEIISEVAKMMEPKNHQPKNEKRKSF